MDGLPFAHAFGQILILILLGNACSWWWQYFCFDRSFCWAIGGGGRPLLLLQDGQANELEQNHEPKCKESIDQADKVLWICTQAPKWCYDCSCPISPGMWIRCTKTWTRPWSLHPSPCLGSTLSSSPCQSANGRISKSSTSTRWWRLLASSHCTTFGTWCIRSNCH